MKATGIVRKVDELGRIVLPMELRRTMNINERDPLEIFVEGENIILRKYTIGCIMGCGEEDWSKMITLNGNEKPICNKCLSQLNTHDKASA